MTPFYRWASTASGLEVLRGGNQVNYWNIHLSISIIGISILHYQCIQLTGKTEYAKHVVRNITFSKAAGDDNITGQTASAQVLFYLNVHLFATIVSIQGIWEVGVGGIHPPPLTSVLTSRNGMRWIFVPGISLV